MSNELKPCPFCGGEVYYRVTGAAEELPPATAKYLFNNRANEKAVVDNANLYEVVRCKDCRMGKGNTPKMGAGWIYCENNEQYHKETHFCSYGERRCEE